MDAYFGRFRASGARLGSLPPWARSLIALAALPGLVLLALSIVAVVISILALLLLAVPVYRLLAAATSAGAAGSGAPLASGGLATDFDLPATGRRHVDVKVIEPDEP